MTFSGFARGGVIALITVLLALSGCKGSRERTLQRQGPEKLYQQARSQPDSKGFPATAADRIKRADEWKKNVADSAAVKARIEKRIKEADESMRKSSK